MTAPSVCLTTYIYGDKYQDYIPLLIYSIRKAYPDYYILLFLHGKLRSDIDMQLRECSLYDNVEFRENSFADCPRMSPLKAKALRWVLWDDKFDLFDYLYIVDIDMLYIKEDTPLHEQHVAHMNFLQLPFSNILRKFKIDSLGLRPVLRRIKHAGVRKLGLFLVSNGKYEYLATGLHFISVKPYYNILTPSLLEKYKRIIYSGRIFNHIFSFSNEAFLHWILTESEFDMKNMGIQSESNQVIMLDFRNPQQKDFRPHHGIHLGIFRTENENLRKDLKEILDSPTYDYYMNTFKKEILPDSKFRKLLSLMNPHQKEYIERLCDYYNITLG